MLDVLTSVPAVLAVAVLTGLLLLGDMWRREPGLDPASSGGRGGPNAHWYRWLGLLGFVGFLGLVALRFVVVSS